MLPPIFSSSFPGTIPIRRAKNNEEPDHASNLLRLSQNKKSQGLGKTGCQVRGAALTRLLSPVFQADDGDG
jgi:hypothetical protein